MTTTPESPIGPGAVTLTAPHRNQLWVCCRACDHVWIAAYLPMELTKVAQVMQHLHCPKCGVDAAQITTASEYAVTQGLRQIAEDLLHGAR